MQLKHLSFAACVFISCLQGEDSISVDYMYYDEDRGRTKVNSPMVEISKDFGGDYSLNLAYTHDSISGATPTYYSDVDTTSGASETSNDSSVNISHIQYGNINYDDDRDGYDISLVNRLQNRDEIIIGYNYSTENDYISKEYSIEYMHNLNQTKNTIINIGYSYQNNDITVYCSKYHTGCTQTVIEKLFVDNYQLSFTQVINKTSTIKGSIFYINENGYHSDPYMNVVRNYYSAPKIVAETKPKIRIGKGIRIEYSKALNKKLFVIPSYRYYVDDWDIRSHTFKISSFYELNRKYRLKIMYRAYSQTKAYFYNFDKNYFTDEKYASSDTRVSEFNSTDITIGLRIRLDSKISVNCAYSYYKQDSFNSYYTNIGMKYLF